MQSEAMPIAGCSTTGGVLSVFELLGYGGFLLDDERQVLAHNTVAANFLGGGLTMRERRVAATDRASDMRLQRLIEAVLAGGSPGDTVGVRRDFGLPLLVLILRIREDDPAVVNAAARLLLVACAPERSSILPRHMLADMFGLTQAEAGIATAIAAGRQPAEIAADRGISIETVRWHLKIVFAKTQTRGQAQLAALLTRLAFLVPHRRKEWTGNHRGA